MSHYKPYPAYKDSGVEWLGRVPEHWVTMALQRITTAKCDGPFGSAIKSENYTDSGVRVIRLQNIGSGEFKDGDQAFLSAEYRAEAIGNSHDVKSGDLLIAGLGDENNPLGRTCVASETLGDAIVKADCYRFRVDQRNALPDFLAKQLSSTARVECGFISTGSTRERLNLGLAASRIIALPPSLQEQEQVVKFLSYETARIDALIEKKTRFIELLREKRQALITHAVTKGLDPNVKMKDSGVEWLGEVPEHWLLKRFRDLCISISTGPFGTALGNEDYVTGGVPIINPSHIVDEQCCPDPDITVSVETAERLSFWAMRSGDLVTARRGELGRAAVITDEQDGWICGTGSLRVRPDSSRVLIGYLHTLLQSRYAREWLNLASVGATMANLNEGILGELPLAVPPSAAEQEKLLASLEMEIVRLSKIEQKASASVALLKERRSALITAAVTGQIDLREPA
ncbi:restriction endonuclease subunit S [Pseudomonas sp. RTS1]|uniref:restriction endonuclease subunit S n=1 Tax=unclassified Pseudomonas TaxID=196821 RepID=UPI002B22DA63|nr:MULTISPECIES: restriction endonuclease subunit S [unclassified Pseudomonas]MEA9988163.1 restriction endonuclease subunit S [Pseudomonas sp. RTS1]MEB0033853.1 restriction endonuclease subunit S [Pseudomonas sp. RTS2]MEB0234071.1 restriction endonuclease subunit S [Pseudomonas sp. 5S3]MEB0254812.1 restriction endonuclease subunit S [Pseudomonas sp. 5S2]